MVTYHTLAASTVVSFLVAFVLGSVFGKAMEQKALADILAARDHFKMDAEQALGYIKAHLRIKL